MYRSFRPWLTIGVVALCGAVVSPATSQTAPAATVQASSKRSLSELSDAVQSPDLSAGERERLARNLATRPGGRAELAEILTNAVFAVVASGPPQGISSYRGVYFSNLMTYDTAEQLGVLLCDILAKAPSPSVVSTVMVETAIDDLVRYNPASMLIGRMEALADAWTTGKSTKPATQTESSTCASTDTPSTPCLQRWINDFTQPGEKLSRICLNKVAGLAAMGFVPDAGGRSDEDDQQRSIHYCVEGNAFLAYERWHPQLRRDAPRQFARMEQAFRIARRLNLIVLM